MVVKQFRNEEPASGWTAAAPGLEGGAELGERRGPARRRHRDPGAGDPDRVGRPGGAVVLRLPPAEGRSRRATRCGRPTPGRGRGRRFPELPDGGAPRRASPALARRLHENRIWFRDFTSGNVLLHPGAATTATLHLSLVDLNRARVGRRLTLSERTRDLARMPIHRPEHQERFLRAYWRGPGDARRPGRSRGGSTSSTTTPSCGRTDRSSGVRGARSRLRGLPLRRGAPTSTSRRRPPAPRPGSGWSGTTSPTSRTSTPARSRSSRSASRDARTHWARGRDRGARAAPDVRRYRALSRRAVPPAGRLRRRRRRPAPVARGPGRPARAGRACWARGRCSCASTRGSRRPATPRRRSPASSPTRGHEVSFAVPQNRDLVRDRGRWREALDEIAERFTPYGRSFQVGQAVNRSKWGVWTPDEYAGLVADARERLARGAARRRDPRPGGDRLRVPRHHGAT